MAIKSGQILHTANGFVIDRIQTGGVSNLNIPETKIYELGNYQTVATVRDIPELTFDIDSTDVSTEIEAVLHGQPPTSIASGREFDFSNTMPFDVVSPFKSASGAFDIVKGIIVPYLTLESAAYKFGVGQNASETFSARGDSVYYVPGTPVFQEFSLTSGANIPYTFSNTAVAYTESGHTLYALSACVKNPATGAYLRLFLGDDYTNTSTAITILANQLSAGYTKLHVTYGTATAGSYPQTVHQSTSVKPAALRAKDICVYVSDGAATPALSRWTGVQSIDVTRSVTLENDEELCNTHYVSVDYDVPNVTGTINVKSVNPAALWSKIAQVGNVSTSAIVGPYSSVPLEVAILLNDPDTGATLKTIEVADARFLLPAAQGRVQTKLEVPFKFTSDAGLLSVFDHTDLTPAPAH